MDASPAPRRPLKMERAGPPAEAGPMISPLEAGSSLLELPDDQRLADAVLELVLRHR
jgi:hypothetical protein